VAEIPLEVADFPTHSKTKNRKIMQKVIIFFLFVLTPFFATAQRRTVEKLEKDRFPNLKLAYTARLNQKYPGLSIGAEFMMQRKTVTTKRMKRTKEKYLTANFSFITEPDLYDNLTLHVEWLKRTRYGSSGFFTECAAGFGVGRGINYISPTTYVRNPDGSITEKEARNRFIMAMFNAGLGYDLLPKTGKPILLFAKTGLYPIYLNGWAYNTFFKTEVGVLVPLQAFKK
jgi:hypothetical protein